jgi:hypothetical protein
MKSFVTAIVVLFLAVATFGQTAVNQPRVYLESASKGSNRNSDRDQSMEMSKDFLKDCPDVKITILQEKADYTIRLNHIEHGLLIRDNQIQVFNKDGDLVKNKEGGSIRKNVKQVCQLIRSDWVNSQPPQPAPQPATTTPAPSPAPTAAPVPQPAAQSVVTMNSASESLGEVARRNKQHQACLKLAADNPSVTCN